MKRNYILLILMILSGPLTFTCSENNEQAYKNKIVNNCKYDINGFLLSKLTDHRILALTDSDHRDYMYKERVVLLLESWLDSLETGSNSTVLPQKLFLVLERDSLDIVRLYRFFKTGDIFDAIVPGNLFAPQFTTSAIEFYHDLRKILKRIEKINLHSGKERIGFKIIGIEKYIDINNWSIPERDSFFVYERDQYSSKRLIEILQNNPDFKALIFYGAAHLLRERAYKQTKLFSDSAYYLAHYIDLEFGRDFYIVFQLPYYEYDRQESILAAPGQDYIIENSNLAQLYEEYRHPNKYKAAIHHDACITYFDPPAVNRSLYWVKSRRIVKYIMNNLNTFTDIDNDFSKAHFGSSVLYLSTLSGHHYPQTGFADSNDCINEIEYWQSWYKNQNIDVIGAIMSLSIWRQLLDSMMTTDAQLYKDFEKFLVYSSGLRRPEDNTLSRQERVDYYRQFLSADSQYIVLEHMVHLLWIGNNDETARAIKILQKSTGQDLLTAKEWTAWWRENYRVF